MWLRRRYGLVAIPKQIIGIDRLVKFKRSMQNEKNYLYRFLHTDIDGVWKQHHKKTPPPEYIYHNEKADLDYSVWGETKDTAVRRVTKLKDYDAKNRCRKRGYVWTLKTADGGSPSCEERDDGRARCQLTNVELECYRLKPGTVGMGLIPFTQ